MGIKCCVYCITTCGFHLCKIKTIALLKQNEFDQNLCNRFWSTFFLSETIKVILYKTFTFLFICQNWCSDGCKQPIHKTDNNVNKLQLLDWCHMKLCLAVAIWFWLTSKQAKTEDVFHNLTQRVQLQVGIPDTAHLSV